MASRDILDTLTLPSNRALDKAQEIANKILKSTPHLAKQLPADSILKSPSQSNLMLNTNSVQMPAIKRTDQRDVKKKATLILGGPTSTSATASSNAGNVLKMDYSISDWQKKYVELETRFRKLEDDYRILQIEKEEKEQRYIKREAGYRRLVDELHEELKREFSLQGSDKKMMDEIEGLHRKIMDNVGNIQLKTSKVLLDQEKDIIRFFNNKVNDIKKQFEDEKIKQGKKDMTYEVKEKQLISELDWIKDIAKKIDQENQTLTKKVQDLKANQSTQENDREILLKEVIIKKKTNAVLKSQIDQYERIVEEVIHATDGVESNRRTEDIDPISERKSRETASVHDRSELGFSLASNPRFEQLINKLKIALAKEKRKVQQLKAVYIKELESKSVLEKVVRSCIEEIKEEIFVQQKPKVSHRKLQSQSGGDGFEKPEKNKLIEKLINDERILTLIYDKTFYAGAKKIEIPVELLKDDDYKEDVNFNI